MLKKKKKQNSRRQPFILRVGSPGKPLQLQLQRSGAWSRALLSAATLRPRNRSIASPCPMVPEASFWPRQLKHLPVATSPGHFFPLLAPPKPLDRPSLEIMRRRSRTTIRRSSARITSRSRLALRGQKKDTQSRRLLTRTSRREARISKTRSRSSSKCSKWGESPRLPTHWL